jgi:O-antigen ligase
MFICLPREAGEGTNLERTASINTRITSQNLAVTAFRSSPIIGIGFNNYPNFQLPNRLKTLSLPISLPNHNTSPDNSWLFVLATTGIFGFIIFLIWYGKIFISALQHNQLAAMSLLIVGIHSLFNNTFFYSFVLLWLFTILAMENEKANLVT